MSNKPELTVTVDRGTAKARAPSVIKPAFAQAAHANEEVAEQVRARRRAIHARAAEENGSAASAASNEATEAKEPLPEREDLDSVELKLPNGKMVLFGPPPNVSLTMRILQYYGDQQSWSLADEQTTRALMCVRSVDGVGVKPVSNPVDRTRIGNILGDEGIAICILTLRQYWPFVRLDELPVVKKNQRGA